MVVGAFVSNVIKNWAVQRGDFLTSQECLDIGANFERKSEHTKGGEYKDSEVVYYEGIYPNQRTSKEI